MNGPERTLSSAQLRNQWGWSDEDFVEALRMGLPAYELATRRALSADDIAKLGESVTSGRPIDVRCRVAEVEQFNRDHPEIFPRGLKPRRPTEISPRRKPRRPELEPAEPSHLSVERVAERWACSADLIRCLVADGLLPAPEGAGPEGWFDREGFREGHDPPPSNFEIFKAERAWGRSARWKSEAIRKFERTHPFFFEGEHLTSVPEGTQSSLPVTPAESPGQPSQTIAKQEPTAKAGASPADESTPATASVADKPTPAVASDSATDVADARREITTEDLEAAVEVAIEMCRWWGEQSEAGKRPMGQAVAHVKQTLSRLCKDIPDARLKMIAFKAKPKPVQGRPGRRD